MLNLIKYEFLRKWKWLLAVLFLFIMMMSFIIQNEYHQLLFNGLSIYIIFLVLVLAVAYDHITRMYNCLFTDEGQLLFTLPLSGYCILGGKLLAMLLEWVALILCAGLVVFINLMLMPADSLPVEIYLEPAISPNPMLHILGLAALYSACYFIFLLTIYLSLVLVISLCTTFKHGKILSCVIFIVLTKVMGTITGLLGNHILNLGVLLQVDLEQIQYGYCQAMAIAMVYLVILFSAAGYLLDRKINI